MKKIFTSLLLLSLVFTYINGQTLYDYEDDNGIISLLETDTLTSNINTKVYANLDTVKAVKQIRSRAKNVSKLKSRLRNQIKRLNLTFASLSAIHESLTGQTLEDYVEEDLTGTADGSWKMKSKMSGLKNVTVEIEGPVITKGGQTGTVSYPSDVELLVTDLQNHTFSVYKQTEDYYEGFDDNGKKIFLTKL